MTKINIYECCTKQTIFNQYMCCNYAKYSIDNYFDTHSEIQLNLDAAIHVLTPKLASQWLT